MSASGILWYLYTAGVPDESGYQWYAITPDAPVEVASRALYASTGGCNPNDHVAGEKPSLLFGRGADDGWVLFAGGLVPPDVPRGRWRRIHVILLGIAPPGVDPAPLVEVAARAFAGELADRLPVRWDAEQRPEIAGAGAWPPAARDRSRAPSRRLRRCRYIAEDGYADRLQQETSSLSGADLGSQPRDRLLILWNTKLDLEQAERVRPWLAVGGQRVEPQDLKEYQRRLGPDPGGSWQRADAGGEVEGGRPDEHGEVRGEQPGGVVPRPGRRAFLVAVPAAVAAVVVAVVLGTGGGGAEAVEDPEGSPE